MADFSAPVGPHGLYEFGFPDELVDIHFPKKKLDDKVSAPWFWYITPQTPRYFQYLGNAWGHGWQCEEFLPIIKILPIDTRPLTPTTQVGFTSVDDVARAVYEGKPISSDAFGRFRFTDSGGFFGGPGPDFFFKIIGKKKPRYRTSQGLIISKTDNVRTLFRDAVNTWNDDWNTLAALFNQAFQSVDGLGGYTVIPPNSPFALPTPGPDLPLSRLSSDFGKYYFGPMPATAIFNTGGAAFWKSAYCFNMGVGQLDATKWDMSVFPPQYTADPLLADRLGKRRRLPSSVTGKFGGYNLAYRDFPQNGLNIN